MLRRRINNKQSMAYEQNAVSFRCINMKMKLQYYTVDGRSVEVLMGNDVCPHDMFVVYCEFIRYNTSVQVERRVK